MKGKAADYHMLVRMIREIKVPRDRFRCDDRFRKTTKTHLNRSRGTLGPFRHGPLDVKFNSINFMYKGTERQVHCCILLLFLTGRHARVPVHFRWFTLSPIIAFWYIWSIGYIDSYSCSLWLTRWNDKAILIYVVDVFQNGVFTV